MSELSDKTKRLDDATDKAEAAYDRLTDALHHGHIVLDDLSEEIRYAHDLKRDFAVHSEIGRNELTDEEFEAAYEWVDREKDRLTSPLKEAMLKLVNNEERRRMT